MSHETKGVPETLTSDFILVVLGCLQQRTGEAVPGQLFPHLRQHVMGYKPHTANQCVEHILESRLKEKQFRVLGAPTRLTAEFPVP